MSEWRLKSTSACDGDEGTSRVDIYLWRWRSWGCPWEPVGARGSPWVPRGCPVGAPWVPRGSTWCASPCCTERRPPSRCSVSSADCSRTSGRREPRRRWSAHPRPGRGCLRQRRGTRQRRHHYPIDGSNGQQINQSIDRSIDRSINQSINQWAKESINRTNNPLID